MAKWNIWTLNILACAMMAVCGYLAIQTIANASDASVLKSQMTTNERDHEKILIELKELKAEMNARFDKLENKLDKK